MRSKRPFGATRRLVAMSVAVLTVGIGLVAGGPAAHAGSFCGWTGGWAPITLVNGWASEQGAYNSGDPSYCLEASGMVYLSGSLAATPGTPSENPEGAVFGQLPLAERPAHVIYLDVYTEGSTYGILRIDTNGYMEALEGATTEYTSLAGVSFPSTAVQQTGLMPLQNGWESAQGTYNTGDPSYSVSDGVVTLSGSMMRPAGTPGFESSAWAAAILPSSALPSDNCFGPETYAYQGGMLPLAVDDVSGTIFGTNAQYTSLAGVSYPAAPAAWQALTLLNGTGNPCNLVPSYLVSDNVVYLTGGTNLPAGFNGEVAVLPPAARPAHQLYMLANNDLSGADAPVYVTVRIDPSGAIWIYTPSNAAGSLPLLGGLSFHTLS